MAISNYDLISMEHTLENAEFHAKAPNSPKNRMHVYGAFHGSICKAKKKQTLGDAEAAALWYDMAFIIKKTCMELNPYLKEKNFN